MYSTINTYQEYLLPHNWAWQNEDNVPYYSWILKTTKIKTYFPKEASNNSSTRMLHSHLQFVKPDTLCVSLSHALVVPPTPGTVLHTHRPGAHTILAEITWE